MKYFLLVTWALIATLALNASDALETSSERHLNTNPVLELAVQHLKALRSGDILTAYSRMSSKDFKDATPLISFIEMVKATPQFKQFEGVSLSSVAFEETRAHWQGNIHDRYGLPLLTISYAIVFENGKWVVETMQALPYTPYSPQYQQSSLSSDPLQRKHYLREG